MFSHKFEHIFKDTLGGSLMELVSQNTNKKFNKFFLRGGRK
jgi:hypothetical protein